MAATGQTINDRLNAVRYALAGQGLARTVCKATTEEVLGPKKKHMDYLLACTDEPNVSIPQLANLLIDRSQHTSWAVVFKSLITIHHLMNYGNERFTQYLATSNHSFELNDFMDRTTPQGYNMSTFVRRYAKYINDKISSYKTLAIDICKIKPGKDNALRTMNMDNLTKTLPVVHLQFDSLLSFDIEPKDLNNGVIMAAFRLLYKDSNRIFAAYQEAIINLIERYFKLNRKKTREALAMYKKYLDRIDKLAGFFRVVEQVGLDKSEIPDTSKLTSLLGVLEEHLAQLEARKRGATPASPEAGGDGDDQASSPGDTGRQVAGETPSAAAAASSSQSDEKVSEQTAPAISAKEEPKTDDRDGGDPKQPAASSSAQQAPKKPPPARPSPKIAPSEPKPTAEAGTSADKKAPPERPTKPPSRPPPPSSTAPTTAAVASPAKAQAQLKPASPNSTQVVQESASTPTTAAAATVMRTGAPPAAAASPASSPTAPPHPPPPHSPQSRPSPATSSQKLAETSASNPSTHDINGSSGPLVDGEVDSGEPGRGGDTSNGCSRGGCGGQESSTPTTLPSCSDGTIEVADIAREPQEHVADTNHVSSNHVDELPDLADNDNNNSNNNDDNLLPPPPPPPVDEAEFENAPVGDGLADGGEQRQEPAVVEQNHQESSSNNDDASVDPDPPPPIE